MSTGATSSPTWSSWSGSPASPAPTRRTRSSTLLAGRPGRDLGLDVDHWQMPLDERWPRRTSPASRSTGREAWGAGRPAPRPRDGGPSLMLNAPRRRRPARRPGAWADADPFSGRVVGGDVHGRGACDMKAGWSPRCAAVAALRRAGVPLRGDLLLGTRARRGGRRPGHLRALRRGWRADACVIPEPTASGPGAGQRRRADLPPHRAGPRHARLPAARRASARSRSSCPCSPRCAGWRPRATRSSTR